MEGERIERALEKAYEAALEVLSPFLSSPTTSLYISLKAEYDEQGVARLVVEVELNRRMARHFMDVLGEAIDRAARAFEKELGVKARRTIRVRGPERWPGSPRGSPQER